MDRTACILCGLECDSFRDFETDEYCSSCKRCGKYWISRPASFDKDLRDAWGLMAATRQADEAGKPLHVTTEAWHELAAAHEGTTVGAKIRKLIEYLGRKTFPGQMCSLDCTLDYPLFDACGQGEALFLLTQCGELGYVEGSEANCRLTVAGWSYLEPDTTGIPGLGFVAMSFDPSLEVAYDSGNPRGD